MNFKFLTELTLGMYSKGIQPFLREQETITVDMMIMNLFQIDPRDTRVIQNVPEAQWLMDVLPFEDTLRITTPLQSFDLVWIPDDENFLEAAITNQVKAQIPSPDDTWLNMTLMVSQVQQAIGQEDEWLYTFIPYGTKIEDVIVSQVKIVPRSSVNGDD